MQDMQTHDPSDQSPVKQGIGIGGKVVGTVMMLVVMWFGYTSVLPNIPIVGPLLGLTSEPPSVLELGIGAQESPQDVASNQSENLLIPGATEQELDIKDADTHARFIDATEEMLGASLASFGVDERQWILDSYGWCASIQSYGVDEANRIADEQMRSMIPPDQVAAQLALVHAGNAIIEAYLCS